jgi:hypothetical protein
MVTKVRTTSRAARKVLGVTVTLKSETETWLLTVKREFMG